MTEPTDDMVERAAQAIHSYCSRNMVMTYLDADEDCTGIAEAVLSAIGTGWQDCPARYSMHGCPAAPGTSPSPTAEQERAKVVAWLRYRWTDIQGVSYHSANMVAAAIERGEHLKEKS